MTDRPASAPARSTTSARPQPDKAREPDAMTSRGAAQPASQNEAAPRTPLRSQLLAALVALGRSALWPGTTPQAPPAQPPGCPHHQAKP